MHFHAEFNVKSGALFEHEYDKTSFYSEYRLLICSSFSTFRRIF